MKKLAYTFPKGSLCDGTTPTVEAVETACPGIIITPGYEGGYALTHAKSGLRACPRKFRKVREARYVAAAMAAMADWRQADPMAAAHTSALWPWFVRVAHPEAF